MGSGCEIVGGHPSSPEQEKRSQNNWKAAKKSKENREQFGGLAEGAKTLCARASLGKTDRGEERVSIGNIAKD
jgi:hypothetical protein